MSDFAALNTAFTGLDVHRRRIDVIGENIANASTPGYRRRTVDLSAIEGPNGLGVFTGTDRAGRGVEIRSISRVIDPLLEAHVRSETSRAASLGIQAEALNELEANWASFGDSGISAALRDLGAAFDDLVNDPGDTAIRAIVLQRGDAVAAAVRDAHAAAIDVHNGLDGRVDTVVDRVNSLASSIAASDANIIAARAAGADAASLEDGRDALIDELTSLVGGDVRYDDNGGVSITLDGLRLVGDGRAATLSTARVADAALGVHGLDRVEVQTDNGRTLTIRSGDLAGTLDAANGLIGEQLNDLATFAQELADSYNTAHTAGAGLDGTTGRSFFDATGGPGGFSLHADVAGDPTAIAARGATAGSLDTTVAEALAALSDSPDGPSAAWDQLVTELASVTAGAMQRANTAGQTAAAAEAARTATSGVSLDEEMTELISAQRAYEASARMISTVDEMLNTLINNTGLVGR